MGPVTVRGGDAVDLQIHTIHSDGTWLPEQLFDYLAGAQFRVVAVTDHDHMSHIQEMVELGRARGIQVVPAVEATTDWHGRLAHVLCFATSFTNSALADVVHATEAAQSQNTADVYEVLLKSGFTFPPGHETAPPQRTAPVRPIDNARMLLTYGYVPTIETGLEIIRDAGFRSITADLADVVHAAHESGGVALISHPGRRETGFTVYDRSLLDEVRREVPLDGIEVWYPSHTSEQVAEFEAYAREHGLLRGAGSDSHGPNQRLPIRYAARDVRELLERSGVHVDV